MTSFAHMATKDAVITGPPAVVGGKRGPAGVVLAAVKCTPLDWLSAEASVRMGLDSLVRYRETFIDGPVDVPREATLTVDNVEYIVKGNEPWDWRHAVPQSHFTHLALLMLEAGN